MIGAGGGFILVPILLLVYPSENTELITSTSLAVVFFNALSGTWAYSRMKRVDYKSGIIFAIATIPGAILGAHHHRLPAAPCLRHHLWHFDDRRGNFLMGLGAR